MSDPKVRCHVNNLSKKTSIDWPMPVKDPIRPCPGFAKKELATYKIDLLALCQFGCLYCSSNTGNLLRINTKKIKAASAQQVGKELNPRLNAEEFFIKYDGIFEGLIRQLESHPTLKKKSETLQFGMLVDNFSPSIVSEGLTYKCLKLLLEQTSFKIRILTKSSAVCRPEFLKLFLEYPDRVMVGLSCGSLLDTTMRNVERGTTKPTQRARTVRELQSKGIKTFGMFCPILPGLDTKEEIEKLYSAFQVWNMDEVWCEPYNDRQNWKVFQSKVTDLRLADGIRNVMLKRGDWNKYARDLAENHALVVDSLGFKGASRFLLYESSYDESEKEQLRSIPGVLFQSKPSKVASSNLGDSYV